MKDKIKSILRNKTTYIVLSLILFAIFFVMVYFFNQSKQELNNAFNLLEEHNINYASIFKLTEVETTTTTARKINTAVDDAECEKELTEVVNKYVSYRYNYNDSSDKNKIRNCIQSITTTEQFRKMKDELSDDTFVIYEGTDNKASVKDIYYSGLDTVSPSSYMTISCNDTSIYNKQKTVKNYDMTATFSFSKEKSGWKISSIELDNYDFGDDDDE